MATVHKAELFSVDKQLSTPAYLQLKEKLIRAIDQGDLKPGEALPSERDLADALHLSRMTVRRAFEELVVDHLVERRQGSGTYVRPQRLEQTADHLLGFVDEARNLGFKAGSKLLESGFVIADQQVADALGMEKGSEVFRIVRLRTADDEPLALQIAYIAPHLSNFPIELLKETGSLYQTIERHYGIRPQHARQTVSARFANKSEGQLLKIARDVPLLALERMTFDTDNRVFEFVRSAYRSDKYQFVLDLRTP